MIFLPIYLCSQTSPERTYIEKSLDKPGGVGYNLKKIEKDSDGKKTLQAALQRACGWCKQACGPACMLIPESPP